MNTGKLKMIIDMKNTKEVSNLFKNVGELIHQIEISDFKDSKGHNLKNNVAYQGMLESVRVLTTGEEL